MTMRLLAVLAVAASAAAPLGAATYQIDPVHSSVAFKVRHLVGKVPGRFAKFSGTFDYAKGKPGAWNASAEIETTSIDTGVEKRDNHLRSPDFFDVEKCPKIVFRSTKVTDADGDRAKLHGDLTIHCVTKPVVLDLELGGETNDPKMGHRAGATATTRINRKDFGLKWNMPMEAGGWMVGDDVDVTIEIEGVEAQAPAPAPAKAEPKEPAPAK